MSHQRSGKTYRAAANDGTQDMKIRNFFKTAAAVLKDDPDSKFYFEQVVEHINAGGNIMTDDPIAVRRILGC